MPILVEPDQQAGARLLEAMPPGAHSVPNADRLMSWLQAHPEEFAVVLGPGMDFSVATTACEDLRVNYPTCSVVIVREEIDTHVLTQAMKAGARDVATSADLDTVEQAVARAAQLNTALRGPGGSKRQGKVITVFSPKGGVGKTTMSVNLALALNQEGARRVCLVDLDLAFGDVAITMQLFPTHSIEQAVGSEEMIDEEMLSGLLTRHEGALMVLAAPAHPDVRERITPVLVSRVLRTLREMFDFVVVDTAPAFDDQTLTALDETDECVVVATLDVPTLKNVKVALETLEMLNIAQGHKHLLLNRADDAVGISVDKVESILGLPVAAHIASSIDIAAATNAGNPIVVGNPAHVASSAVLTLASEFAGEPVGVASAQEPTGTHHGSRADDSKRSGLFRRKR